MSDWQQLNEWYQSDLGRALLDAEQKGLIEVLDKIPGVFLLQVGGAFCFPLPLSKRQFLWSQIVPEIGMAQTPTQIVADFHALPILPQSFDVLLLPHTLEFVEHPECVIEQVAQSVKEGGYIIIFGFNPYSLFNLARGCSHLKNRAPWQGNFWSPGQLRRWLSANDLSVELYTSFFYRPPFQSSDRLKRWFALEAIGQLCWPNYGGSYMIVAGKHPIEPINKGGRQLLKALPVGTKHTSPVT